MVVLYTTLEKLEQAERIIEILLTERLVACANMWPIHSMYTFKGKMTKSDEIGMYLKTSAEQQEAAYKRLIELHPYECPAIMTMKVEHAPPAFSQWIYEQTSC